MILLIIIIVLYYYKIIIIIYNLFYIAPISDITIETKSIVIIIKINLNIYINEYYILELYYYISNSR